MARQPINTGTPGDPNTGDTVNAAFVKVEANFVDLYANYLPEAGGTVTGAIAFDSGGYIKQIENIELWNQTTQNNKLQITMPTDEELRLQPVGSTKDLNYNFTDDKWYIGSDEVVVDGSFGANNISTTTYLTLGSANVQAMLEELKDEVDAAVLASGSGDMLKSTYDIGNSGVVDNSEALGGQTSAYHLSRTNHTGTQLAATISDLDSGVAATATVTANTAKVTNATHTGEVTGSTALTIDPTAISGKALVTAVTGDMVLIWDASDSQLKRVNASGFLAAPTIDSSITDGSTNPVTNNAVHDALADLNSFVNTNNINANKIIDGAGSGLDADTVDGIEGANLLRSDVDDTMTANLTANAFITGNWTIDMDGSNNLIFQYSGSTVFQLSSTGTLSVEGDGKFNQTL